MKLLVKRALTLVVSAFMAMSVLTHATAAFAEESHGGGQTYLPKLN